MKDSMIYRNLGDSGLKVSALSFGNWLTGHTPEAEESQFQCFSKAIDSGINFFDTAEQYGDGTAESIFGNILKRCDWNRDDLVIATKFINCGKKTGLSRKRLIQGMKASLSRLQLDFVDVMYLHKPDYNTPIEETVRTVNHLIEKGKADYWGTSEFSAYELQEIHKICEKYGFIHPVTEQVKYNMFIRNKVEVDYVPLYENYGMGATIFNPLMGGILSGKYNDLNFPEGSRILDPNLTPGNRKLMQSFFLPENREKTRRMFEGLTGISQELECTQAQLAIAWCIKNNDVSSAIFGATRPSQVEDNVGAVNVVGKLTADVLSRIEEIIGTRPQPPINWRTWTPMAPRR